MNLSRKAIIYITFVSVLSILFLVLLFGVYRIPNYLVLIFWSILAIAAESLAIQLPNGVGVSVGLAINLAAIIAGGPLMGALVAAFGVMFRVPKVQGRGYVHLLNEPFYKTVFNMANAIISIGLSGVVYLAVGGSPGGFSLISTLICLPVYVFLNTIILTRLISIIRNQSFISMWMDNIKGTLLSSLAVGTVGVIMALAYLGYGPGAVLLFFGPLLLARFSFKLYMDMRNVYLETIKVLNRTMEAKDAYTSGHASRVQEYAVMLAMKMELPEKKVQNIKTAALLHDIGKIGIDDNILKKPLKLNTIEYGMIQKHPTIGAEILKDVDFLKDIAEIIKHHHERYDGKGYPDGLKGNEISVETAILAIADVYDAMTSNRPYRESLQKEIALDEIRNNAGTQFNPEIADKFLTIMSA